MRDAACNLRVLSTEFHFRGDGGLILVPGGFVSVRFLRIPEASASLVGGY